MAARIPGILPLLFITLLCVGIVEGGYQALEYFVLSSPVKNEITDSVASKSDVAGIVDQKRKHDYRVILKRNLFGPPPAKEGTEATTVSPDAANLESTSLDIVLMGTVSGSEGTRRAIILEKKSRKQDLYETGDAIQGAFVKEILRGKVILVYNGKDEFLDMSEAAEMRPAYKVARVAKPRVRKPRPPVAVAPGATGSQEQLEPLLSPQGTPRRVVNRPRAVRRPTRIRKK